MHYNSVQLNFSLFSRLDQLYRPKHSDSTLGGACLKRSRSP
jgi:hypothetical protein